MNKKTLKKWYEIYPSGTKQGDDEAKFFKALARNPKWEWRSVAAIAKESGLSEERVEEIISKYHKKGMVFNSPKNPDHWAYWERVPEMLEDSNGKASIADADKDDRINSVQSMAKDWSSMVDDEDDDDDDIDDEDDDDDDDDDDDISIYDDDEDDKEKDVYGDDDDDDDDDWKKPYDDEDDDDTRSVVKNPKAKAMSSTEMIQEFMNLEVEKYRKKAYHADDNWYAFS